MELNVFTVGLFGGAALLGAWALVRWERRSWESDARLTTPSSTAPCGAEWVDPLVKRMKRFAQKISDGRLSIDAVRREHAHLVGEIETVRRRVRDSPAPLDQRLLPQLVSTRDALRRAGHVVPSGDPLLEPPRFGITPEGLGLTVLEAARSLQSALQLERDRLT